MLSSDIETADALRHLSRRPGAMDLSRRRFLQALAAGAGTVAASTMFSNDAWGVQPNGVRDGVLLLVSLYGGNDGLNTVIPVGNSAYYAKRPDIAIAADTVLPVGAGLGLHPKLTFLKSQFDVGNVAIVQGVGTADPDYSHFSSMENWMAGWGGAGGNPASGWLGRYVDGLAHPDVLRTINIGWESVPQSLAGVTQTAVALSPDSGGFGVEQADWRTELYAGIRELSATTTGLGPWAGPVTKSLRDQLDVGLAVAPAYPADFTGTSRLKNFVVAARLINANIGARVISVSIGGFDTHENQLGDQADNLGDLNDGLQLFWSELSPYFQSRTTALVWSEFGRRLLGNKSNGSDHGAAGPVFLMGPRVRGGLHASYPSLTATLPNDQLAMSVDYRAVYAQVLDRWFGADSRQILGKTYTGLDLFTSTPGDDNAPAPPTVTAKPSGFVPITPERLLDTRSGIGATAGKLGAGKTLAVKLGGVGSVPASAASAVLVNVTVTEPTTGGYLTVWPEGSTQPTASNLNFSAGQTVPNLVLAKLGTDGKVDVFNASGATHVIGDVVGYFVETGGSGLMPLEPSRLIDTRSSAPGAIGPGKSIDLQISGRNGVPATGAQAVVMNVTAIDPTTGGYLTVWPAGQPMPTTSSLNFASGQTVPNLVVAKLGVNGRVSVFNAAGSTHFAVDVVGYFATSQGSQHVPMTPVRLLDTRGPAGPITPGGTLELVVAGVAGVPEMGVVAVTLNVTAVDPSAAGYVTVWPTGAARPNASSLNFTPHQTVPNLVVAKVGTGRKLSFFNASGNTHLVVDLCGYFLG